MPQGAIQLINYDDGNDLPVVKYPRADVVRKLSIEMAQNHIGGAIAECGVHRGNFAAKMNDMFFDRKFYLFDTFTGFDVRDIPYETGVSPDFVESAVAMHKIASPDLAALKCVYRNNVFIKQGYIPETFVGLEDEEFAFVNLDVDLYAPTLASLRFFAPKMVTGGMIMVHDYYSEWGVSKAVLEFADEYNFIKVPIGYTLSVLLLAFGRKIT